MSGVIQLLPDSIANQIAAGEVISRPASAVKELLENAVDSGASKIKLTVKDAGRTLIQVSDNGCGMNETDARLCFERHATSKIKSSEDLYNLHTKGFRGEALASIAAVAQVELKTKRKGDTLGTCIICDDSTIRSQDTVSTSEGTVIGMKNLFFNVPARRNFLKSDQVELRHIIEEFQRVALIHPEIEFSFSHNGDQLFHLPVSGLKQRLVNFFGKSLNEKLVPVESSTELVSISGFIFKPESCKKVRGDQFLFINNRYVKSALINHSVQQAYSNILANDHHVGYFLYLQVPKSSIDVNIHPTKTEIKLEHEKDIYTLVNAAVREALGKFNMIPSIDFNRENEIEYNPAGKYAPIKAPGITVDKNYNPFNQSENTFERDSVNFVPFASLTNEQMNSAISQQEFSQEKIFEKSESIAILKIFGKYCIAAFESKLFVIHIRRAFERVVYDSYLNVSPNTAKQQLLFTEHINLSPAKLTLYMEMKDELSNHGFDIHYAGENTLHVSGMPAVLSSEARVAEILEQIIDEADKSNNGLSINVAEIIHRKLSYVISLQKRRESSIVALEELTFQLMQSTMPTHTPGGLLIFYTMSKEELERRFS